MNNIRIAVGTKIFLTPTDSNTYQVADRDGKVLLDVQDDYFIYFQNANFKNGKIDGRYMGVADNYLVDVHCKEISLQDGQFTMDGKPIRTARMVAVNNKTKAVVVIQSR